MPSHPRLPSGPFPRPFVLEFGMDKLCRLEEASNPGPVVKFSTLNIVSASKNQEVIIAAQSEPSIQVFTETCMTKVTQETLLRRSRTCNKTMIHGALCNPRQNIIRGASYTRGQSGGVLVMADLPAQPGHLPMPTATWASTRIVDAVVSLAPGFVSGSLVSMALRRR